MDPTIPSSIRVALLLEGSRGDIQPYLAIALTLQARGNVVKIFTNSDQTSLCDSFAVPSQGVFYSFSEATGRSPVIKRALASGNAYRLLKGLRDIRMENLPTDLPNLWLALESFGPTLLLAGALARPKALLYSVAQTIPLIVVDPQVLLPLSDRPPVGFPTLPFGLNRWWWKLITAGSDSHLAKMKAVAKETLDIDVNGKLVVPLLHKLLTNIPDYPAPVCVGVSTHVIPRHPEWPTQNFYPCGFFTIGQEQQQKLMEDPSTGSQFGASSQTALEAFLEHGPAPVYLGWGSMVWRSPKWMVTLAIEALRHSEQRGVLLGGWAKLGEEHVPDHLRDYCSRNVLFVPSAPHEWLFPRCACIVHHGGSGTTAASVRSGVPTIVTPLWGDQFEFADGVHAMGCGVRMPQLAGVTPAALGHAIARCVNDHRGIRAAAAEAGARVRAEDGCRNFCQILDDWLLQGFASGEWLRKQRALLDECEESFKARRRCLCSYVIVVAAAIAVRFVILRYTLAVQIQGNH